MSWFTKNIILSVTQLHHFSTIRPHTPTRMKICILQNRDSAEMLLLFVAKHASGWSWLFHFSLTLSAKWSRYPSYAAVFWHIYTNWNCDIVTPRGPGLKPGHCTFLFPPKSDWAQGLYLLNASYVLGAITPRVRLGLKIEPAHRQTLGVNDISISEEQDTAFETVALWRKPHILEF